MFGISSESLNDLTALYEILSDRKKVEKHLKMVVEEEGKFKKLLAEHTAKLKEMTAAAAAKVDSLIANAEDQASRIIADAELAVFDRDTELDERTEKLAAMAEETKASVRLLNVRTAELQTAQDALAKFSKALEAKELKLANDRKAFNEQKRHLDEAKAAYDRMG